MNQVPFGISWSLPIKEQTPHAPFPRIAAALPFSTGRRTDQKNPPAADAPEPA